MPTTEDIKTTTKDTLAAKEGHELARSLDHAHLPECPFSVPASSGSNNNMVIDSGDTERVPSNGLCRKGPLAASNPGAIRSHNLTQSLTINLTIPANLEC